MRGLLALLALGAQLLCSVPAQAVAIVDTGAGPANSANSLTLGPVDGVRQYLAAEFTTDSTFTLNRIRGWITRMHGPGGAGTIAIYTDGGQVPGRELFSQSFTVGTDQPDIDWYGLSDIAWTLAAGTYWVAFEVREAQTLFAAMPAPAPTPLTHEAVAFASAGPAQYFPTNALSLGIRIFAEPANAPAPNTLALVGLGLFVPALIRRKTQRNDLKAKHAPRALSPSYGQPANPDS